MLRLAPPVVLVLTCHADNVQQRQVGRHQLVHEPLRHFHGGSGSGSARANAGVFVAAVVVANAPSTTILAGERLERGGGLVGGHPPRGVMVVDGGGSAAAAGTAAAAAAAHKSSVHERDGCGRRRDPSRRGCPPRVVPRLAQPHHEESRHPPDPNRERATSRRVLEISWFRFEPT